MLDFGWAELLIIGGIALFVIGPKDLPAIAYQVGRAVRRLRYMQYALMGQFDNFMEQTEASRKDGAPAEPARPELDHDPYGEADADAHWIDETPPPPVDKSGDRVVDKTAADENQGDKPHGS